MPDPAGHIHSSTGHSAQLGPRARQSQVKTVKNVKAEGFGPERLVYASKSKADKP